MNVGVAREEVERFRALVGQRLGLLFADDKLDFLAEVLHQRIVDTGSARAEAYFRNLDAGTECREELQKVAEQLTVGETYFFRNPDHFRVFTEVVLPDRARAQSMRRQLRILSAGCSTGAEAYSIAMLVRERLPDLTGWHLTIKGIDVNTAVVATAVAGRYSAWALRQTSPDTQERWFCSAGREFVVEPSIRGMVSFEQRNLVESDPAFWQEGSFDVVFLRNVIMYFSLDVQRAVVARIANALVPGGYLFLGHAETLRGLSDRFHLRQTHETFYYQRREAGDVQAPSFSSEKCPDTSRGKAVDKSMERFSAGAMSPVPVAGWEADDTWVNVIQRASDRIAQLSYRPGAPPASEGGGSAATEAPPTTRRSWDLGIALQLMREEKFREALDVLAALPAESLTDSDAQLLRAVLLTNAGDSREAEKVCAKLLVADELNAGAHYVMALCREQAGDRKSALEHDRSANYLDPGFAMPHLHMGLIAKRAGHLETARRELGQALVLLAREEASRILLFGGGFNREALVQLCRTSLRACGGEA